MYEYSLGSARESRDWYWKGRHILGEQVTLHRMEFLTQIIRLLTTTVPQQRSMQGNVFHEERAEYEFDSDDTLMKLMLNPQELNPLLQNIPMP